MDLSQNCSIKRLERLRIVPKTFDGGEPRIRLQIAVLAARILLKDPSK